jgi:cytochrome c-type biogenesis protein CcmE
MERKGPPGGLNRRDQENDMAETKESVQVSTRKGLSSRQTKFLIGGIIIAVTAGYLVYSAASGSAAYYLTVEEIRGQGPSTRDVRVSGLIAGESIVWEARDLRLEFEVVDDTGKLPALYHGPRPDMFRDEAEVVLEGRYSEDGIFEARTMLLKCPSKYEEAK